MLLFNNRQEIIEFCNYYSIEIINGDAADLKTLQHYSHKLSETQPLKKNIPYLLRKEITENHLQGFN